MSPESHSYDYNPTLNHDYPHWVINGAWRENAVKLVSRLNCVHLKDCDPIIINTPLGLKFMLGCHDPVSAHDYGPRSGGFHPTTWKAFFYYPKPFYDIKFVPVNSSEKLPNVSEYLLSQLMAGGLQNTKTNGGYYYSLNKYSQRFLNHYGIQEGDWNNFMQGKSKALGFISFKTIMAIKNHKLEFFGSKYV